MHISSANYIQSVPTISGCPKPNKPEFAFVGRSNVGKSSLINMITNRNGLAQTSNSPGKTKNINHFLINDEWYLVDLPGYGYAKTSQLQRGIWMKNLENYLTKRENLMNVFLLIDSNIKPQQKDIEFANWLGHNSIPFSIVFTKADKAKKAELAKNIEAFEDEMLKYWKELPPSFLTSAEKKIGRDEILNYIQDITKEFRLEDMPV